MSTAPVVHKDRGALLGESYAIGCFLAALAASPFLDRLTNVLLLLTTLLFAVVTRYSKRYLAGDPRQAHFTLWLCFTGSCVFALILVENLLLFVMAWSATSLSLHHLLQFYKDRPAAIMAARKKFIISRLGDVCLISVLVLTHRVFGSWDFNTMFVAAARLRDTSEVHLICILLVFAALLKSAQFPFHSWLPDTMETPTPVSALMHAGIINAGGILVLRLRDLITLSEPAMIILCLIGAFTAAFAAIIMLTQASVKRCLAFSTVGQMGFMMLECGLGAFHLALLHLVAHSFYKAHAFLSTGGVVKSKSNTTIQTIPTLAILGAVAVALTISILSAHWDSQPVLTGIFTIAMAQLFWTSWTRMQSFWLIPAGLLTGIVFSFGYFALDRLASELLMQSKVGPQWLAWPILLLFTLVALLQTQMPRLSQTTFGLHLYVHARNGFYINTLANRFTTWLWPTPAISTKGTV